MEPERVINSDEFCVRLPREVRDLINVQSSGRYFNVSSVSFVGEGSGLSGMPAPRQVIVYLEIERSIEARIEKPFTITLAMGAADALHVGAELVRRAHSVDDFKPSM